MLCEADVRQMGAPQALGQLAGAVQADSVQEGPGALRAQLPRGGQRILQALHAHPRPQLPLRIAGLLPVAPAHKACPSIVSAAHTPGPGVCACSPPTC